jgi:L-ascorbate metabolism protein UlaG (beta-lactamase superfamily)
MGGAEEARTGKLEDARTAGAEDARTTGAEEAGTGGAEGGSGIARQLTPVAAERLGGTAVGLRPWEERHAGRVTVTAVPAQHGPDGTEHLTGPVTGFVLAASDGPRVYVSGDNASLRLVTEVAGRFPQVDLAVLFAGAARTPLVDGYLTLTSQEAVEAARILGAPPVLPLHTDGWAHFTQDGASFRAAFAAAGLDSLLLPAIPGQAATLRPGPSGNYVRD